MQTVAPEVRPGRVEVMKIAEGILTVRGLLIDSFHASATTLVAQVAYVKLPPAARSLARKRPIPSRSASRDCIADQEACARDRRAVSVRDRLRQRQPKN